MSMRYWDPEEWLMFIMTSVLVILILGMSGFAIYACNKTHPPMTYHGVSDTATCAWSTAADRRSGTCIDAGRAYGCVADYGDDVRKIQCAPFAGPAPAEKQ